MLALDEAWWNLLSPPPGHDRVEWARQTAELLSLGLTVPGVVLSLLVIRRWAKATVASARKPVRGSSDWLLIGVTLSFCGGALDSLYWAIPWTLSYLNLGLAKPFFLWGAVANIFFRQLADILAAYCHLRAATMFCHELLVQTCEESGGSVAEDHCFSSNTQWLIWSCVGGWLFAVLLVFGRWFLN